MYEPQSRGEQFARTNELAIEFFLHTVMTPTVLAKLCQLDEGGNLDLEDRKIGTARAGVKVSLVIGTLCRAYIIPGLGQIHVPVHIFYVATNW